MMPSLLYHVKRLTLTHTTDLSLCTVNKCPLEDLNLKAAFIRHYVHPHKLLQPRREI